MTKQAQIILSVSIKTIIIINQQIPLIFLITTIITIIIIIYLIIIISMKIIQNF